MRNQYVVSYDVCDQRRWRKIFTALHGFGDHIQLSVFRCELSPREKIRLVAKLDTYLKHDEDQVLIFDLGPATGRAEKAVMAIGKPYAPVDRGAVIV